MTSSDPYGDVHTAADVAERRRGLMDLLDDVTIARALDDLDSLPITPVGEYLWAIGRAGELLTARAAVLGLEPADTVHSGGVL